MAGVRVGVVDGKLVANPTYEETKASKIGIVVAGTEGGIVMVESGAQQATEAEVLAAIEFGHDCCKKICKGIHELMKKAGKTKRTYTPPVINQALYDQISKGIAAELKDALNTQKYEKLESYARVDAAKKKAMEGIPEEQLAEAKKLFDALKERIFRDEMLKERRRPDGRKFDEVRKIEVEVGVLPRTHGSALFTRGETQALVTVTLGTGRDEQIIDALAGEYRERFMFHYNMPPYATGETGRYGFTKRREIGHGRLAKRALVGLLPKAEDFGYSLRVVSEITESNGSSSMASVCGGSLALMDAGVPIKAHVAGIAMGLIKEGNRFAVLSDILGDEDHLGDMDFKVAGTEQGITALQMDLKIESINKGIMKIALDQAREARLGILQIMKGGIEGSRSELSSFAPRIIKIKINPEKIRDVIGKGGVVIRGLQEETGTTIEIEDDGTISIACISGEGGEAAKKRILDITADVEVGKVYEGPVLRLLDFGAIIQLLPGRDGLLHISQISNERVNAVSDHLKEGQIVKVKVLEADDKGRVRLSMKAVGQQETAKTG
jgi:polyribonucleotide nucleotidyltransferase